MPRKNLKVASIVPTFFFIFPLLLLISLEGEFTYQLNMRTLLKNSMSEVKDSQVVIMSQCSSWEGL